MHKIQSEKLYNYLKERGVLDKGKAAIDAEKRNYRRLYKNNHAKKQRENKREIRFHLTKQEFKQIEAICDKANNITPTRLAKELLLSRGYTGTFIPDRKRLLRVLKQMGLAINQLGYDSSNMQARTKLLKAEQELLDYLNDIQNKNDAG